jgi:hypothetical protein
LLKEIEANPSAIKERKWGRAWSGTHQEEITICLDGVTLSLLGPEYPDPNWQKPPIEPQKTELERGNEEIDQHIRQSNILWAITHCSSRKFDALIEFLKATRAAGPNY